MPKKNPSRDDVGIDEQGRVIAIGDDARTSQEAILADPRATPVLIVARLGDDLGIRVFGPPSTDVADLLDQIAATYRHAVTIALDPGTH